MTHIVNHTARARSTIRMPFEAISLCSALVSIWWSITPRICNQRTKNHINGIEDFWSYAEHILYNYRGVSRYHFPMYLKEIEYHYNHLKENVFKLFLQLYFGCVSP
jgi:hypothetical protein